MTTTLLDTTLGHKITPKQATALIIPRLLGYAAVPVIDALIPSPSFFAGIDERSGLVEAHRLFNSLPISAVLVTQHLYPHAA